jgi:integrase
MKKTKARDEREELEKGRLRSPEEGADDDDEAGGDDELPKVYKNAMEEILAEFGDELIGGYFGKEGKKRGKRVRRLPATLLREECRLLITAHTKGKWAFRNNLISRLMYATGVRLAEEENLNVADIWFADQTMFVLKKLMGHEYLGTTLIYVETAMAREREEYVKMGPFGG